MARGISHQAGHMVAEIGGAGLSARQFLRAVGPDVRYGSVLLQRFINRAMKDGQKSKTRHLVYGAMKIIESRRLSPLDVFNEALSNVRLETEVRSRRVGGASYAVPVPVPMRRAQSLSIRALVKSFRKRNEKSMMERLASELIDASERRGEAYRWSENQRKSAESNRVFSGFVR